MHTLGMRGTKWELFVTSMDLFAKKGYANVSVKDIASMVGIKAASIYNHFVSKDDILSHIYQFYRKNYDATLPSLEDILSLIGKFPPSQILAACDFSFQEELQSYMDKALLIALAENARDGRAESLFAEVFIERPKKYYGRLLSDMLQLDLIEPLDISGFLLLLSNYDCAAALRRYTSFDMDATKWEQGREMLFQLIREKQ